MEKWKIGCAGCAFQVAFYHSGSSEPEWILSGDVGFLGVSEPFFWGIRPSVTAFHLAIALSIEKVSVVYDYLLCPGIPLSGDEDAGPGIFQHGD